MRKTPASLPYFGWVGLGCGGLHAVLTGGEETMGRGGSGGDEGGGVGH